ncbi:MAG: hypothetical protein ABI551_16560, partial [Polyangiaceae bacterium]
IALAFASFALASTASAITDKHVQGVITAIDAGSITICGKHVVTGKVAPKARIVLDGHKASLSDLKVTYAARADMDLDDAWIQIEASR